MISMMKNEADIVESFIRHSMTFVDMILVADHMSSDKTKYILESLQQEGLPLTIFSLSDVELAHSEVMTQLMWKAVLEYGADLVLPFDADEFLVNTENHILCREILEQLSSDKVYHLNWRRYEPQFPTKDADKFLLGRPCVRQVAWDRGQKTIIGADAAKKRPFHFIQGCHYALYDDDGKRVPMEVAPFLHTAHFHWRSEEQYESKVLVSYINNVSKFTEYTPAAGGLRTLYKAVLAGETLASVRLSGETEKFVLSEFVPSQSMRYSAAARPNAKRNFLEASARMAEAYVEAKYLAKKRFVTVVLPFLGDAEAWRESFVSLQEQTYPFLELLVPLLVEGMSENLRRQAVENATEDAVRFIDSERDGEVFSVLGRMAKGAHVQWLLPGTQLYPRKIQLMSTCLDAQDRTHQALICFGDEEFPEWSPYMDPAFDADYVDAVPDSMLQWMIRTGKIFSGGISSVLMTRKAMDACEWFRGCFSDHMPLEFFMFHRLFSNVQAVSNSGVHIGAMKEQLCNIPQEIPLEKCILHQLEWHQLVLDQRERLSIEQYQIALQNMRYIRARLRVFSDQLAKKSSLWETYESLSLQ